MSCVDANPNSEPGCESDKESIPPQSNDEFRSLLRQAMHVDRKKQRTVLPGVQQKIRERSKGKFFADGWSTAGSPPSTYIVTSLIMLVVMLLILLALLPCGWEVP